MNRLKIYFQEIFDELVNKVSWPTWEELQQSAIIVLVATAIITSIIFLMDQASLAVLEKGYYNLIKPTL